MTSHELRVYTSGAADYPAALMGIGENIARLREAAGFKTQVDFAKALSVIAGRTVPSTRVSDWENNRYKLVSTETLLMIAKVANVSVDDVISGVDPAYDAVLQNRSAAGTQIAESGSTPPVESEPSVDAPRRSRDDKADSLSSTATPLNPFVRDLAMRIATVLHEVVAASDAAIRRQTPDPRTRTAAPRARDRRRRRRNAQG